jgi:hypothetical protein
MYDKFRNLYKVLFQNNKLIKEMKRLLEIFPESVIIRSKNSDSKSQTFYSNNEFNRDIANIKNNLDELKNIKVTFSPSEKEFHKNDSSLCLSKYLKKRAKDVEDASIFEDTVELKKELKDIHNSFVRNSDCRNENFKKLYSVKIIKVNWEGNPNSFMYVFIDMTNIIKLEKANNNIRCQKIMFASASHEFRTPLNAILNSFKLIKMHPISFKIEKFVKMGATSATLLLSLVDDILNLSKIESGIFNFTIEPFDIGDLLQETIELFTFQ